MMRLAKDSQPFPIGSLILRANTIAACKEIDSWEELNINCIWAAPTLVHWFRLLMKKVQRCSLWKEMDRKQSMDSEDQFWLKNTGIDYDTLNLLGNEKLAKNLELHGHVSGLVDLWIIGHCLES